MTNNILVIGAAGQIGTELVLALRNAYGNDKVIATDLREVPKSELSDGPYEQLDVLDKNALFNLVKKYDVSEVYLLAALLSATAEKNPALGWI